MHVHTARPAATALARLLLLLVGTILGTRGIFSGGFRYPDEPRHALSGAFLLDLAREGGLTDPVRYGEAYYARYPALAIPYYAPPFFHAVEALFFCALGVSASAARAAVAAFYVGAVLLLFEVTRRDFSDRVGFLAALVFATFPWVLFWSWRVVLEPPTAFMVLLSSWLLLRFLDRASLGRGAIWIASLGAAVLTKQTAVFVLPAHLALLAIQRPGSRRTLLVVTVVLLAVGAANLVFWAMVSPYQFAALSGGSLWQRMQFRHLWYYPAELPLAAGWTMTVAIGIGLVRAARRRTPVDWLFLLWIASFMIMMAAFTREVARYAVVVAPALGFLAARGLDGILTWLDRTWLAWTIVVGFLVPNVIDSVDAKPWVVEGYEQAAIEVAKLPGGTAILVDAYWDGDFVFFWRQHDQSGRLCLRSSKVLYTYASYPWIDFQSFVQTPEDIEKLLREYGIRYVVAEDVDQWNLAPGNMLRSLLDTPKFKQIAQIPIHYEEIRGPRARFLDIYEYLDYQPAVADAIDLKLPGLNRSIRVPIRPE